MPYPFIVLAADGPAGGGAPGGGAPAGDAPGGTTTPAAPGESEGGGGIGPMLPMLVVMFLIFYVLLIRPQSKERKKREALIKGTQKGDRVVTTAGIHGEVVAVEDTRLRLEIDDGVRVWFDRAAIWQVHSKDAPATTPGGADSTLANTGDRSKHGR